MRLLLSSDALPRASYEALSTAGRRRSLAGLELTLSAGHHHGADASSCAALHAEGRACFPEDGLPVAWLHLPAGTPLALRALWASAAPTETGVLLREPPPERPLGRAALVHGTDPAAARRAAEWAERHDTHTCWEVCTADFDPDRWAAVLDATGSRLAHVRLLGAGPEAQAADDTDGTGWLLGRLALAGYDGTVALVPSAPERLPEWERWLLHTRGWGCGTAAAKAAARARAAQPASP